MSKKKQTEDTASPAERLQQQLRPVFAQFPQTPEFIVSEDGKVFLPRQQRAAERYAERWHYPLHRITNPMNNNG
jgi:hypothetical protein